MSDIGAVNTTVRTIAGAIGTALLVTIMAHNGGAGDVKGMIHGMNAASFLTAGIAVAGLVLTLLMNGKAKGPATAQTKKTAVSAERRS